MLPFLLGLALTYAGAAAGLLVVDPALRPDNPWVAAFVLVAWVVPIASAWGAAEAARALRPRARALNPVHARAFTRFARGVAAGVLGVGLSLAGLVLVDQPPSDAVVMGAGSALATLVVLLVGRSARAGTCRGCGYDLRGLTVAAGGRCPECGDVVAAGPMRVPNPGEGLATIRA